MESDGIFEPAALDADLRASLADADRLSTTAWTDAPDMPSWMYPAVGLWFAALLICLRLVWSNGWLVAPIIALMILEGIGLEWLARRGRSKPSFTRMPPEFKRPVIGYLVGLCALVAVSMVLVERSVIIGFAFCAIAATIGMIIYRAHWYRAAAETRSRVANP